MSSEPHNTSDDDDYQQWIDGLLRSPSAEASTPSGLAQRIETNVRSRQRRSLVWKSAATLAAAASIALLAIYQSQPAPNSVARQSESPPMVTDSSGGEDPSDVLPARATFVARGDLLAIPIESDDPQVTIIQVYSTTQTHRRRQREATLQAINDQLDSIKQFSTNGG